MQGNKLLVQMKYNILIMLLSVLCLFGCSSSENEPQRVSFSFKEQSVSNELQTICIPVLSNCVWTISEVYGSLIIETPKGEGNMDAFIYIRENKTSDDITHTAVITSEDGSSTDKFVIYQKATPKFEFDYPELINCKGGNVDIKISTNEQIASITTPDWLKQTSSRAMKDFTYSFNAEENKTGGVRYGTVTIKSEYKNRTLNISQDSYDPISVDIPDLPERADTSFLSLYCHIEPEYADWRKLELEASHSENVKIYKNNIQIYLEPGYNSIRFNCNHKNIYSKMIKYFPEIEVFPKVSQCVLMNTNNGEKYNTTIQVDISMHGYNKIKHYSLLDKDYNIILKDEGKTDIVNGMMRIKTDPILLDVDNFKEKIKEMTFEVEFDFDFYAKDLGSNIIRKKIEYPSSWDVEE